MGIDIKLHYLGKGRWKSYWILIYWKDQIFLRASLEFFCTSSGLE